MSPVIAQAAKSVGDFGRRLNAAMGGNLLGAATANVGRSIGQIGEAVGKVGERLAWLGAGGGLLGGFIGKQILDTASSFETLRMQLTALEGSSEGAQKALDWAKTFAKETPLELEQVVDVFTRMRSFGLDPMNGTMQAVADTAARMGKGFDFVQRITLALGQAWTKTKLQGDDILQLVEAGVPVWDLLAKAMHKPIPELQKLSSTGQLGRHEIELLIEAMGKNARGASAEFAKTWVGQISMLSDQWTNLKETIAEAGAFDFLKGQLVSLNETLDRMSADGSLKRLADDLGHGLRDAMVGARDAAIGIWHAIRDLSDPTTSLGGTIKWAADTFGGWNLAIGGVAAVIGGPLIAAVGSLVASLATLGTVMLATPIGWMAAGVAGLVAGAVLLYEKWDWVSQKLSQVWASISAEWEKFTSALGDVGRSLGIMSGPMKGPLAQLGTSAAAPATAFPAGGPSKFSGSIDLKVSGLGAGARVAGLQASPGIDLSAELARGPSMATP